MREETHNDRLEDSATSTSPWPSFAQRPRPVPFYRKPSPQGGVRLRAKGRRCPVRPFSLSRPSPPEGGSKPNRKTGGLAPALEGDAFQSGGQSLPSSNHQSSACLRHAAASRGHMPTPLLPPVGGVASLYARLSPVSNMTPEQEFHRRRGACAYYYPRHPYVGLKGVRTVEEDGNTKNKEPDRWKRSLSRPRAQTGTRTGARHWGKPPLFPSLLLHLRLTAQDVAQEWRLVCTACFDQCKETADQCHRSGQRRSSRMRHAYERAHSVRIMRLIPLPFQTCLSLASNKHPRVAAVRGAMALPQTIEPASAV